jgi:RHH-type proline utilization regulon transcriptional repressor/proline dehydrogenase/delta 1-pyrroline-5-carboxylate dehydrogenase
MTKTDLYEISANAFIDEHEAVQKLLGATAHLAAFEEAVIRRATVMVEEARSKTSGIGVEAFLQQYGLNTAEGVAIMCLAEALLRIPDTQTADRLIKDKFDGAEWEKHLGTSDSLFVNASSWGLMLTGKVVNLGDSKPANIFNQMVGKLGDPVIRTALRQGMRFIGSQFVLGETTQNALANSMPFAKKGYRFSYDILGEGARSDAQAQGYVKSYEDAIGLIAKGAMGKTLFAAPSISVKLSALHPRYNLLNKTRVMKELYPRIKNILLRAKEANITVSLDAEEASRLDIELMLFEKLCKDTDLAGWNGLGFVVQAYQKRAYSVIDFLAQLAKQHQRIFPLRLVKGAYWDSEIKWAQMSGLPGYPVFTRKEHTDASYMACADKMLRAVDCFYPQFATHNARTISSIEVLAEHYAVGKESFEFQRLHGMGESIHDIVTRTTPSRIYAPVGAHKDLLAYLIRRLLENGANTSFVNLLMDKAVSMDELLYDPIRKTAETKGYPNSYVPSPKRLYGLMRDNSSGVDFGNAAMVDMLSSEIEVFIKSPLTSVSSSCISQLSDAIDAAQTAFVSWSRTSAEQRALMLETCASMIEEHRAELIALCMNEAGKTVADGIAEIREAADFCRYYAAEARTLFEKFTLRGPTGESNVLSLHPRGTIGCISPWNFPFAIFIGQVAAALVTGNCVIAKPAEQTPRIALRAVELLYASGVPKDVLHCVVGDGETIGSALVADLRINGIVFTGSVTTAQIINRTLAARRGAIGMLIAETGGLNAMVVDSSALIEQAVDDIVLSAFGSAGQRCSALRLLYVQEDIADHLIGLLKGAMQELRVGMPQDFASDIGPVIDKEAQSMLLAHIEAMKRTATFICAAPFDESLKSKGHFVPPHAFELSKPEDLQQEIFGPILHIVRFKALQLEKVAGSINSAGYGLTFGIHSRIEDHVQYFVSAVHAGNIYVNRSMIGATVGVQPFGGEGLSGTGPKAGGPNYLTRFVTERVVSINTTAIGGNLSLLAQHE